MRKFLFITTLLLLSSTTVFAQDQLLIDTQLENETVQIEDEKTHTVTSSNQYFELELKKGTQNPFTKTIPFTVRITSKIDSSKTQILWNVPTVFKVNKNHNEFVSLKRDQSYTFSATLKPEREGNYDISVNVISWQYDSNKSNSANYNISLDESLVIQPVEAMYTLYIILFIIGILGGTALIVFLIIKGVKILTQKAKVWFTPPY